MAFDINRQFDIELEKSRQSLGQFNDNNVFNVPEQIRQPVRLGRSSGSISSDFDTGDFEAGKFESSIGSFVRGFGSTIASVPKAIGEAKVAIQNVKGTDIEDLTPEETTAFRLGQTVDEFFKDVTDVNPKFQKDFSTQVASGLGSAAGFLAGGVVGKLAKAPAFLLPSALGGASLGVEQVEDYKRTVELQGGIVDPEQRGKSFGFGAIAGLSEALPITRALKRLDGIPGAQGGVTKILKEGFKGGLEELTQEALQQTASNLIAKNIVSYDSDRNLFQDVEESAQVGGSVGFILNTLLASIGARRVGKNESSAIIEQAKSDLSGITTDEDLLAEVSKDQSGKLLNPTTNEVFQTKVPQEILQRFINLSRLRKVQGERGNDISSTQSNIDSLISSIDSQITEDQKNEVLKQELTDISGFITKLEKIGTGNLAEELLQEDAEEVNLEDLPQKERESIEALRNTLETNAIDRGFKRSPEEVILPSPREITDVQEELTQAETSQEGQVLTQPRKKAETNTASEFLKTPENIQLSKTDIQEAQSLILDPVKNAERIKDKYGSLEQLQSVNAKINDGFIGQSEVEVELDQEQQDVQSDELIKIQEDETFAKQIQLETDKDSLDSSTDLTIQQSTELANELNQQIEQGISEVDSISSSKNAVELSSEIQDKISSFESQIDRIDEEIFNINEIVQNDPSNEDIKNQLNDKLEELVSVDNSLRSLRAGVQKNSTENKRRHDISSQESFNIDKDLGIDTIDFNESPAIDNPRYPKTQEEHISFEKDFNKIVSKILPEINKEVNFHYITDVSQIQEQVVNDSLARSGTLPKGLFHRGKSGNKSNVYIFGNNIKDSSDLTKIFFHETIGHFGMERLFGRDWNNFLDRAVKNNSVIRRNIWEKTHKRWNQIIENNPIEEGSPVVSLIDKNGTNVRISQKAMRGLTGEYISELAKRFSDSEVRSFFGKTEKGILMRAMAFFKHVLRKFGVGENVSKINDVDLMSLLAETTTRIFNDSVLGSPITKDSSYIEQVSRLGLDLSIGDVIGSPKAINTSTITNEDRRKIKASEQENLVNIALNPVEAAKEMGAPETDIQAHFRLRNQNFGNTNNSIRQQFLTKLGNKIISKPWINKFMPLGNIKSERDYDKVGREAGGKITEVNKFSKNLSKMYNKLNILQKEQLYDFFTTQGADPNTLAISDDMRELSITAKQQIIDYGQFFSDQGLLKEETFQENKGSYLPRRYLAYLSEFPGGGKTPSFQNYLRKQKDLPEEIKGALGEIKDPSFLVSETIATLGRDSALLDMLNTINKTNDELSLDWVLRDEFTVEINGKKMSLNKVDEERQRLITIRNSDPENFQTSDKQRTFNSQLLDDIEGAIAEAENSVDSRLIAKAQERGIEVENPSTFLKDNYRKIPSDRRFGDLKGTWVRKEIFNDLTDTVNLFDSKRNANDPFVKWMGPRGHLTKIHQIWKGMKVPLNVPSWFRNGIGNFVLLDISSRRSSPTLMKWLTEESIGAINDNPSKWWTLAQEQGLFGTTFSSQELFLLRQTLSEKLKQSNIIKEKEGNFSKVFPMLKGEFFSILEATSDFYGLLEGAFKTIRLRDHITEWEEQTGGKFDKLEGVERAVLIDEAAFQANQAIFDYSKVPNLVRQTRRFPLGAPFLTFTYKAFGQTLRSLARRPQKFIKYAALPYILSQAMIMANPEIDDDDMKRIARDLPRRMKDKSSVFLIPFKDSNDHWSYMDYGYFLPWQMYVDAGLYQVNHFEGNNISDFSKSTFDAALKTSKDIGFLGGPIPQVISAYLSNTDSFTGRPIVNEFSTSQEQFNQSLRYAWSLAAPSWLSHHGFLGRTLDQFGLEVPGLSTGRKLDRLGNDRETAGQTLSRLVGTNVTSFDPKIIRRNNILSFQREERGVIKERNRIIRDRNITNSADKAGKLRANNEKLKSIRLKRREFLSGN